MDPTYSYLTGWRHRFEIRPYWRWSLGRLDLSYRFEWNDRKDRSDVLFSSFSAVRQRLRLKGRIDISTNVGLTADLRYRHSRYRNPDEITTGVFQTRKEDRYRVSLIVSRRFSNGKELSARIRLHPEQIQRLEVYLYRKRLHDKSAVALVDKGKNGDQRP